MEKYQQFMAEVPELVMDEAKMFWERAEWPEDFCIQHVGMSVVFGGTNRVIWSYRFGFRLDESYCTDKFIQANIQYLP